MLAFTKLVAKLLCNMKLHYPSNNSNNYSCALKDTKLLARQKSY